MKRLMRFFKTTALGGLVVVMPSAILFLVFRWLFYFLTDLMQPIATLIKGQFLAVAMIADVLAVALILIVCFLLGLLVKTKFGVMLIDLVEQVVLFHIPGYRMVKETIVQMAGDRERSLSRVALVNIFGTEAMTTGFITDTHADGSYTVFIPSGLNATSGMVIHLPAAQVHPVDVPAQEAMRTIVGCGTGSRKILSAYRNASRSQ